ncbi:hypothetical protein FBU30_010497 [Linnemannia zychae]|nr:hypothetical protein FBU30_010497 [Linnemannia zychae]
MSFLFNQKPKNVYGELRLSPTERQQYDALWRQANPHGNRFIDAIWEVTALNAQGQDYFDRNAFDATLRLIGHAQKGFPTTVALLTVASNPTFDTPSLNNPSFGAPTVKWPPLPATESKTYRDLFRTLEKEGNLLKYSTAVQVLTKSGLPSSTLARVMVLVDRQERTLVDEDEFVIAMYLVMCLRMNIITDLPSTLPAEVLEICGAKPLPSPNDELHYYNVLFSPNPNLSTTEREREILELLKSQQANQEQQKAALIQGILDQSKAAELQFYKQYKEMLDHKIATQEDIIPFLDSSGIRNNPHAATFAESYNNAMKQQSAMVDSMIAAKSSLPTTQSQVPSSNHPTPQSPTVNPPPYSSPTYSAQQPSLFTPTSPYQQPSPFSPLAVHQQFYPQYTQYQTFPQPYPPQQQSFQQMHPHQQQQPIQHHYPLYQQQQGQQQQPTQHHYPPYQQQQQQQQGYYQPPIQVSTAQHQQEQHNPYTQYTQHALSALGQTGPTPVSGQQLYPTPPQLNPQYNMSSENPQQTSSSLEKPQQPLSPGNPQYQNHQQPLSSGNPQQYNPPRHPQMLSQSQVDPSSYPLTTTLNSSTRPPLPPRAPQDRNDYSVAAATAAVPNENTSTSTIVAATPPPLPRRPTPQLGGPQELHVRAPQYRESEPELEAGPRPFGAPQLG